MKRVACALLVTALTGIEIHHLTAQQPALSDERVEDLTRLQEWLQMDQSFSPEGRRAASGRIRTLLEGPEPQSDVAFYLQIASITALADNGHSNVSARPAYRFGLVPIRTFWFSDGLHVVRAQREHARLLGARLDSVEGVAVEDLVTRLGEYHGGLDEHFRQYYSTPFMLSPAILHAAGVGRNAGRLAFSLELQNGTRERVQLSTDTNSEQPGSVRPWRTLVPEAIDGEGSDWSNAAAAVRSQPLAFQDPEELYRYQHLADDGVVYIQLRLNFSPGSTALDDFVASARARIARDKPRAIILDNRYNPGGDFSRTGDFGVDLPTLVPDDGAVFVLTSNATFSAGIYTSFFPKTADPERTLVVGERVGDRERFWAETGRPFALPNLRVGIGYSLRLHDLGEGCHDIDICHVMRFDDRWNIRVGSLDPDVEVGFTFDDFASGRDPVMSYVMRLVREGR